MPEDQDLLRKELAYIVEKFPEYKLKILDLYASREDFKTLCDDYWYCKNLAVSPVPKHAAQADPLLDEYRRICVALEEEALRYLQTC